MRKKFVYTLFLISTLCSSCFPQCHYWKLAVVKADCPSASYVKVYLPPCNTFSGLEIVFIACNRDIRLYCNTLTLLFPCLYNDEKHSEVFLTIEEEKYTFIAERLQGGQSLLMPEEAQLLIILSLLETKCRSEYWQVSCFSDF